jgi:hypothetical protein
MGIHRRLTVQQFELNLEVKQKGKAAREVQGDDVLHLPQSAFIQMIDTDITLLPQYLH